MPHTYTWYGSLSGQVGIVLQIYDQRPRARVQYASPPSHPPPRPCRPRAKHPRVQGGDLSSMQFQNQMV
eukprot:7390988-Prymnesium_polylepis.1